LRSDLDVKAAARLLNVLTIAKSDSQLLPYLNSYFKITDEAMQFDRSVNALVDLVMNGITRQDVQNHARS
jgi:hypothetical protein